MASEAQRAQKSDVFTHEYCTYRDRSQARITSRGRCCGECSICFILILQFFKMCDVHLGRIYSSGKRQVHKLKARRKGLTETKILFFQNMVNIPVGWSICRIQSNQVGQSLAYGFSAPIGLLYDRYGVPTTAMSLCQCQWSKVTTLKQEIARVVLSIWWGSFNCTVHTVKCMS